ncbi:MAG: helicase-associated domain-containing protein [Candidatus Thorarchaeota archaeon]
MAKESLERELEHMFREDLIAACQNWGIDMNSTGSGDSLVKMLAERMKDNAQREALFNTFTLNEIDLIGMLVLSKGALSYDRLKPYRKIYSYGQLNQTERDLRKKGVIIRRMMSRSTDFGREVAEFKIIDFFMPHLKAHFTKKPKPNPAKPKRIRITVNERDSLLLDMLVLVSYIAKHEIKMTSSWEFPKRDIDHIKEAMSKSTEERFELVQKLARKSGAYLIVNKDKLTQGKIEAIFSGNQAAVSNRILLSALGRTRAIWATPDQPTEYTLNLIICRLRESNTEDWIQVSEMRDWIRRELFVENQPLKWIQVSDERVAMALETPILLGLVEGAYKGKNLLAVRLTDVGSAVIARKTQERITGQETFFVLPNFEMTVFTSEMNYYKLYRLLLISDPVMTDVVSTFRITEKSIFQAVEMGQRENDIIEFLKQESSKPIPANIVRSIKDWTSQTTFATVSDIQLFETDNKKDLEGLMLIPKFEEYVVRQVGPTAVIIRGDIEIFAEDLKKHKCHIKRAGAEVEDSEKSKVTSVAEQVLIYGEPSDSDIADECLGCPALQSCNRVVRKKSRSKRKS